MKQFKYVAVNLQKEKFSGKFIAQDEQDLATQLAKQGLFLVSAKPYGAGTPNAFFTMGTGKVQLSELTTFCRQFAVMINSGISILGSLEILREQHYSTYFKSLLEVITDDVKAGMMFSAAMDKHKKVFPDFFRSMVKVGETSGKMDSVLISLADYYENNSKTKKKIKSALAYPIMLSAMTVGIIAAMLLFIVPTFRSSLSSLNIEPEGLTAAVYAISDFAVAYSLYILAGIVVVVLLLYGFAKTKKGSYFFDWLKVNCPVIKGINIAMISARFARGFGLLLSSGMDIVESMDAVVIVFGNKDMEARFEKAKEEVKHGMSLAIAFDKYHLFPEILIQMIAVGERTNAIDDVLSRTCSFFDEQAESALNRVTSMIRPIMLGIMGAVIAVLFVAIYSPMLSIMGGLGG